MKKYLFIAALFAGAFSTHAQNTAKGKVVDANNNPLAGATISGGGISLTTTDKNGTFSIDCSKNKNITISFVGYEAYAYSIKNCDEIISVSLMSSDQSLANIDITATSNLNKSMLSQPASIAKLSPVELQRGTGLFLDDAINTNVPGVTMNRRTVGAGQQFNIRGYGNGVRGSNGANSNFDGQGYKVYLNGIAITDAEGITLMDDIDFGSVGNVEIVKGPAGTLYGLAIAGAVNLKTIRPEKGKTSVGQNVLIGNYGLRRFTTNFMMGKERSSLLVNFGYQHSDGFMSHAESKKKFVNIAGEFNPNDRQTVTVYAGFSDSYDERGGELTLTQYANRDYTGNPAYIQRNAHSNIVSFRLGVGHTYNFNSHLSNTTTVFGTGISNNVSSAAGWTDKSPVNFGIRTTFDTKFKLSDGVNLSGITGAEYQRQYAQVIGYNMKADPANPSGYFLIDTMRSNQSYITAASSVFTEWTLGLPKGFSITAGVGVNGMLIDLTDKFVRPGLTRPKEFKKTYNGLVSPHFAINKVFNNNISLYASYSTGQKAPVSSYFFIPVSATVGFINETLKPEKGKQIEIGSKGSLLHNKLSYQLAYFNAIFLDKMTALAVPLNPPSVGTAYTYVANGGRHKDNGVEVLLKWAAIQSNRGFIRSFAPFGNFTYSNFKYENYSIERLKTPATGDTIIDYSGKPVAGVAPYVANLGFDITAAEGIYANAVWHYKDGMPITSDNLNRATSYNLLSAKLGIRRSLSSHFDIDAYVGANNITNTQYPLMVFINQLPDAYLPAPLKASIFGGLNLKYNF